jgi:hypothetical protein
VRNNFTRPPTLSQTQNYIILYQTEIGIPNDCQPFGNLSVRNTFFDGSRLGIIKQ